MVRTFTILVCLVSIVAGCATSTASRIDAQGLLHDFRQQQMHGAHYEEYQSFVRTVDAADMKLKDGRDAEAEELYRLAVAKGYVLKQGLFEKVEQTIPSPAVQVGPSPATVDTPQPPEKVPVPLPDKAVVANPAVGPEPPPRAADGGSPGDADRPPIRKETEPPILSERIVGGEGVYLVRGKDTFRMVGSRLGVNWRRLAKLNRLDPGKPLQPGQQIRYNNRKIVPKKIKEGLLINIPERKLYLFKDDRLSATYPVAAGMSKKKDKTIWRTPTGKFRIIDKKENPSWRVPLSIQQEMEEEGAEVVEIVPPGPKNPLGKYALKTSLSGILIHSTTRPASINSYSSHGCIRVMPEHMEALFRDVRVNMPGEIIYQPVKVEVTTDGRVFLEVNYDIYEQVKDLKAEVKRLVSKKGVANRVSWEKIGRVIKESNGVAEEVTLKDDVILATID